MIKGSFPQSSFILRVHYVMASSRIVAEDLIEAVFDDDFELDDDKDSGCDDDNNIYSYLGDPVLRRADLMVAALDEVDDDEERGELMAAALDIDGEGEYRCFRQIMSFRQRHALILLTQYKQVDGVSLQSDQC